VIFCDIIANIDTDFAGFTTVHGNIGRLVLFAVIDAIGFRTIGRTEVAIGFRTNILVYIGNVVHDFSSKYF